MFIVYKIYDIITGAYYISYSNKTLTEILNKKLYQYFKKDRWHPSFILFNENPENINIIKLITFETEKACITFIKMYEHYNGNCINYRQNIL